MAASDITINVTAHNEGLLLHKTLKSVYANYKYAIDNLGITIDINISLDIADEETRRIAKTFKNKFIKYNIYELNFGDLSLCRNYLTKKTNSKYCAFIDGDDLFSENYIHEAYKLAQNNEELAIYSPEYLVSFEEHNYIVRKLDFNNNNLKLINCFETNYFISQSFALTSIFKSIEYRTNQDGYGMEDWDWNNNAIYKGYKFYNIPDTLFFYRRKKNSMILSQVASSAVLRPSLFFSPKYFANLNSYELSSNATVNHTSTNKTKHVVKSVARYATFGSETLKIYLKEQYIINKSLINKSNKQKNTKPEVKIREFGISKEALDAWRNMNKIEPLIRPSEYFLNNIVIGEYPTESINGTIYHDLCKNYGLLGIYKDIVLVPHLIKGGADSAALRLILALSDKYKSNRILVLATMAVDSPWSNRLKSLENVDFINLHDKYKEISNQDYELIIFRIIQNWDISRLHIINSEVGYNVITRYKDTIPKNLGVYLHTYAFDMDNEGYIYNYIANGLVNTYARVNAFITDSEKYKQDLIKINGFNSDKIEVLSLPVDTNNLVHRSSQRNAKKVLWAGRISSAKIVEVAIGIGKILTKHNIELHFYGHLDYEYANQDKFINIIKNNNMYYHGSFDDFSDIPILDYDLVLFTSKNEGMPNIVLETLATNTFIVASDVGAVKEVVYDGVNGMLIKDVYNIKSYVDAILRFYKDIDDIKFKNQLILNKKLISNRTMSAYTSNLFRIIKNN